MFLLHFVVMPLMFHVKHFELLLKCSIEESHDYTCGDTHTECESITNLMKTPLTPTQICVTLKIKYL